MAVLGRDNAGDQGLGALLDELSAQSGYHHRLALVAASAAGDGERLRSALRHPSPHIRSFALATIPLAHLPAEDVVDAVRRGSAEDRRRLRRFVNRHRLTEVAEAVIDDIRRELGDREAASLLPACGEAAVRRLLPELLYAVPNLRSLAVRHPRVLLDHIEDECPALSRRQRDQLWSRVDGALRGLALAEPDRVLALVEASGPSWVVPWGLRPVLGFLVRFDASRVARLIVRDEFVGGVGRWLPPSLLRNARHFAAGDRVAVARALREREHLLFAWVGSLAPGDRADVFSRALDDLDSSNKVWAPGFLDVLPRGVRHVEARRILGVRSIRESDALTLQYRSFLSFDEAREPLAAHIGRPKAEDRALGYDLLISCARRERSPEAMTTALQLCGRLRNDQDPVRLSALRAVAMAPAAMFGGDSLELLQPLVQAVVEARDTSPATLRQVGHLAFKLVGDAGGDPASLRLGFGLRVLDQIAGPAGSLSFPPLDRLLPAGAEAPLIDVLMPRLERDAALNRYEMTLSLARALGQRAWRDGRLQQLLQRATTAASDSVVRTSLTLWLANPGTRSARVASAIAADESVVAVPAVLATVLRSRQDLLDVLLRARPLKGRFLKGDVRFVPVITGGFDRWLPRQHEAYRAALDALIATRGTPEWTRTAAIRSLARLPEIGPDALEPYLAVPDVAVQEAALSGLAWTDEPGRALDRLLQHSGTDRARVAMYAATRCARFVSRNDLRRPLEAVLRSSTAKVTSKKEAARLLGAHRPAGAVDVLLDVAAGDAIHRDLRIAIWRSLRDFLDDERVWRLLAVSPATAEDEVRSLLETVPDQLAERHRARWSGLVLDAAMSSSQRVRAQAFAALASWARWSDRAPEVACRAIGDLDTGPEVWPALRSLGVMLQDGAGWRQASSLVAELARRVDAPDHDAGAERDRPSDQRLQALLRTMAELPRLERGEHRDDLLRVAVLVGGGPDEVTVRLAAVDWTAATATLATIARGLDDRPLLAALAVHATESALDRDQAAWGPDTLGDAADHLIGLGSPGAGVLALQVVQSAGGRFQWPERWRTRLRALRSHPIPDVAVLARRAWTVGE